MSSKKVSKKKKKKAPTKQAVSGTKPTPSSHKLVGKWIIDEAANLNDYPWAAGLPLNAEFTITDGLEFQPGKGCKDAFGTSKQMGVPSQVLLSALHKDGDHSQSTNDDKSLKMRVELVGEIDFVWYKKGNKNRVAINGPKGTQQSAASAGGHLAVGIASLVFNHGGPHGIAN